MKPSELLSDPSKWTQGYYARDAKGDLQPARSPDATCFCIFGALLRCYERPGERSQKVAQVILKRFPQRVAHQDSVLPGFNDHKDTKYEEVISVLQEAGL